MFLLFSALYAKCPIVYLFIILQCVHILYSVIRKTSLLSTALYAICRDDLMHLGHEYPDCTSPSPPASNRDYARLIPSSGTIVWSISHNIELFETKRSSFSGCFSLIIKDSGDFTVIRSRAVNDKMFDYGSRMAAQEEANTMESRGGSTMGEEPNCDVENISVRNGDSHHAPDT